MAQAADRPDRAGRPVDNTWASRLQQAWSGRGALARLLWPLAMLMRLVVATRRFLYRRRLLRSERLPVPVVVVGNLIVGGAGKTPTVMAVASLLQAQGHRPAIVSRGYGRSSTAPLLVTAATPASLSGDEPLLLHLRTGLPVCVGRDRVAASRVLLNRHPDTTILISDDGLQHLALARDLQILVFDERGTGNGWLLPAGPLREPLPSRADTHNGVPTLVVYNASEATTKLPGSLTRSRLAGAVGLASWWRGEVASTAAVAALRGRRILAIAGVARPQRFFSMLRSTGIDIAEQALPDHFDFKTLPWPDDTTELLMTEKDAIKIDPIRLANCSAWVLPLDLQLDVVVADALRRLLPFPAPPASTTDERNGHSIA